MLLCHSRKKRKASTSQPSHPKAKAQKVSAKHQTDANSGTKETEGNAPDAESDEDPGYISFGLWPYVVNLTKTYFRIRKSTCTRKEPQRYKDYKATTQDKGKQKSGQKSGQVNLATKSKKR